MGFLLIGGFIRWLLCRCKTKLDDEVHGAGEGYLFLRRTENSLIGFLFCIIVFTIVIRIITYFSN